jgi:hypothetical protein
MYLKEAIARVRLGATVVTAVYKCTGNEPMVLLEKIVVMIPVSVNVINSATTGLGGLLAGVKLVIGT